MSRRNHTTILIVLITGCVLAAGLAGCSGKVSKSNFDKLEDAMTVAQVEAILGEGAKGGGTSGTVGDLPAKGEVYTWEDGDNKITVTFIDGRLFSKVQVGL